MYISILNLECCKLARVRFHCAHVLVVLRSCTAAQLRGDIVDKNMMAFGRNN